MSLLTRLNGTPLLRPWGVPSSVRDVCLVALAGSLDGVEAFARAHPSTCIRLLVVPDLPAGSPRRLCLRSDGGESLVPLGSLEDLADTPQWEKVFLCPPDGSASPVLTALCRYLTEAGVRMVYLDGARPPAFTRRTGLPDFFREHAARLEEVYRSLADDASREVYAARLKAMMTGNAGYLPVAVHQEYYHPLVRPEEGDIMLDGGVSGMVGAQEEFARSVGERGRVFGFEPIPQMAEAARKALARFPRYHLQCAGLGEKPGRVRFDALRDSSRISSGDGAGAVLCEMTTIDEFVRKHHLNRVDCIKLDVEGAEMLALRGGEETIRRRRPKLIVCLYHTPADMMTIPAYVRTLAPEYELYVAHSSCQFTDTILYARCP